MANAVESIWHRGVAWSAENTGHYLLLYAFKGDIQQVFSKRPNKGKRSLSEIARQLEGLMTRRQLSDCVKAAAFDKDAEAKKMQFPRLTFSHKLFLARVKDPDDRFALAKKANENGFTVKQVKEHVQELNTGVSSEDRALGKVVIRQVADLVRLSTDRETREFLKDRSRLKAALKKADRLRMLEATEDAQTHIESSKQLLAELEETLVEIIHVKDSDDDSDSEEGSSSEPD
jgi:hypothetical protein